MFSLKVFYLKVYCWDCQQFQVQRLSGWQVLRKIFGGSILKQFLKSLSAGKNAQEKEDLGKVQGIQNFQGC